MARKMIVKKEEVKETKLSGLAKIKAKKGEEKQKAAKPPLKAVPDKKGTIAKKEAAKPVEKEIKEPRSFALNEEYAEAITAGFEEVKSLFDTIEENYSDVVEKGRKSACTRAGQACRELAKSVKELKKLFFAAKKEGIERKN